WYSRELADLMAVRIWGAKPAETAGACPKLGGFSGMPLYSGIVPVPARENTITAPGLPLMLARRLGKIMNVPVLAVLRTTRKIQPQKKLNREQRHKNTRDAYAAVDGVDLSGKRVLLVDDIITTGSTVSACALALLRAGAADVFVACLAVDEELPKEKRK
ncbi:MAG: ComF family protein, partial [Gemmiger sp.]